MHTFPIVTRLLEFITKVWGSIATGSQHAKCCKRTACKMFQENRMQTVAREQHAKCFKRTACKPVKGRKHATAKVRHHCRPT